MHGVLFCDDHITSAVSSQHDYLYTLNPKLVQIDDSSIERFTCALHERFTYVQLDQHMRKDPHTFHNPYVPVLCSLMKGAYPNASDTNYSRANITTATAFRPHRACVQPKA